MSGTCLPGGRLWVLAMIGGYLAFDLFRVDVSLRNVLLSRDLNVNDQQSKSPAAVMMQPPDITLEQQTDMEEKRVELVPAHLHTSNATMTTKTTRLIIHIGPPKTASTTLQKNMGELTESLLTDGYLYLGKRRDPQYANWTLQEKLLNVKCHVELERYRMESTTTATIPLNYTNVPCWRDVVEELHRPLQTFPNTDIIVSEEAFSQERMLTTYETRPAFRQAFLDLVEKNNVELTIVAAYRHYEEQLFSAHKMQCEWQQRNLKEQCQVHTLDKLETWMNDSDAIYLTRPLDRALAFWQTLEPKIPIKLLDLENAEVHPTVQFVCNTLGIGTNTTASSTTNSCSNAIQTVSRTHERTLSHILNKREDVVFAIQQELQAQNATNNVNTYPLVRLFQMEYRKWCHITRLPYWKCPTNDRLQTLLERSLLLEERYRPPANPTSSVHKEIFWRMAMENKLYCDFDARPFLKDLNVTSLTPWNDIVERVKDAVKKSC